MAVAIQFDRFFNTVNNECISSSKHQRAVDPSTREKLWQVPIATKADLDKAVAAANVAFKTWSKLPHTARSELLKTFAGQLGAYKEELTELLFKETGKPKDYAESETLMAIGTTKIHAEWSIPDEVQKETDRVKIVTQYVPVGVVGGITPWNFPLQLAIVKIVAAVMAGCPVILKPSPFTPYTALKIGEIAAQVFPPGVVQVLAGDDDLGPWMTQHAGIAKISFTGSIATGKKVMTAAAGTLKRVNLELGGNDAAIVTEDVDVAAAAQLVAPAVFAHSGQICMASKRVYVHESIYEDFMVHFTAIVKAYKPGQGFCSPIQNEQQFEKVKSIYKDCATQGYNFAVGSADAIEDELQPGAGYFISPAVIARPPESSRIVQEEPFGPIIPILTWNSDEEVVKRVNDTVTGLGATIYCRDEERCWSIAGGLEAGSVWVNGGLKLDPMALFGAHKQSGIGGELGPGGMKYYTNPRTVTYWKKVDVNGEDGLFA